MANNTVFNNWTFPEEFEDPFFNTFQNMIGAIDSAFHSEKVLRQTILGGGGTILWTAGGGLSWGADFTVPIFTSGLKVTLAFGPDNQTRVAVIEDGEFLHAIVPTAISENVTINMLTASKILATEQRALIIGWRDGNTLYLVDGRRFTF